MRTPLSKLIIGLFVALLVWPTIAEAQLRVDVTRGKVEAFPIALADLKVSSAEQKRHAMNIMSVVRHDLEQSGLFDPVDADRHEDIRTDISITPVFESWQNVGADSVVIGRLTEETGGQLVVEFRLWDVVAGQQMVGRRLVTTKNNWRQLAHMLADTIYTRITGEAGYFNTRIVYIAEQGAPNRRIKRLAIMDFDGANHQYLTDGSYLVLTPRFSPNQQLVTYMSYERGKPEVFIFDLTTGRRYSLGNFPGMTFAPRFSPDNKRVIMSLARNGNTDIFTMDIKTRNIKRLTRTRAIETAPSYSPDGRKVVFESDRGGDQQLYVMNNDGSGVKRITFGKGRYANPVWSPRGDLIAFTRIYSGKFYIGVIRPDGTGERLITSDYHVEGPTWAPNGRVVMFFKETPTGRQKMGRTSKVYTIDLTGGNLQQINTPGDGSDPSWSPPVR